MRISNFRRLHVFQLVLLYLIVLSCLIGGALFYVWQQIEILKLNAEVGDLMRKKVNLTQKQSCLRLEKATLESLDRVGWESVKRYGFIRLDPGRIVWVRDEREAR
jgi:cell division protein FtsL